MRIRVFSVFFVFFIMGFGDIVGTLVAFAREEFEISKTIAGLLPFVGFMAYGIFSVPFGVLSDRKGKRFVLLLGLIVVLIGFMIPVISLSSFYLLVLSIFLVGSGITVLQVAGNPVMREVSSEGNFSRNLTFAQFIKAIGSLAGPFLIGLVILKNWKDLFPLYAFLTAITLFLIFFFRIKEKSGEKEERASIRSSFALLRDPYIFMMVFGIFLYVGAEVGINSWIATYLHDLFNLDIKSLATLSIGFFFFALMIGRLLGSIILNWISPSKFFLLTSIFSVLGILGLFIKIKFVVIGSIFLTGLAFGNIFPLIFSILVDKFPEKNNELSGLLVMAIVGGAIIPFFMGMIADRSVTLTFLIPLASVIFITFVSILTLKRGQDGLQK
ncbi:MAG: MFS transporter [Acidobacteriota bacterium]